VPYQLGAVHPVNTLPSTVAVTAPAGLLVALANIPASVGRRNTEPSIFYTLGWLVVGNQDGYYPPVQLFTQRTVVYPLPDDVDSFSLNALPGITAQVTELQPLPGAPTAPTAGPAYFESSRNPVSRALSTYTYVAPHASTERATYTVPAGRKAVVETLSAMLHRAAASTGTWQYFGNWQLTSAAGQQTFLLECRSSDTTANATRIENIGLALVMQAGDRLAFLTADAGSSGGNVEYQGDAKLTEFDA
jgi:hypothetical protein